MPKPPSSFSRLGSDTDIIKSVLGSWTKSASTNSYVSGRFGNALECPLSGTNDNYCSVTFAASCTIEWWMRLDGWSLSGNTSSGFPSDGGIAMATSSHISFGVGQARLVAWLYSDGFFFESSIFGAGDSKKSTLVYLTADTWHHIAMVNVDGVALSLYIDGVFKDSVAKTSGKEIGGKAGKIQLGGYHGGTVYRLDGSIDNMKYYDYAKTDFSDRSNERGGMNDVAGLA